MPAFRAAVIKAVRPLLPRLAPSEVVNKLWHSGTVFHNQVQLEIKFGITSAAIIRVNGSQCMSSHGLLSAGPSARSLAARLRTRSTRTQAPGPNELQLDLAAKLALILSSVIRVTRQRPRLVRRRGPGPGRTFQLSQGDSENHQAAARPRPPGCRPRGPSHCDSVSASQVART